MTTRRLTVALSCLMMIGVGFNLAGCPEPTDDDASSGSSGTGAAGNGAGGSGGSGSGGSGSGGSGSGGGGGSGRPEPIDAAPTIRSCPDDQTISAGANCQAKLPDLTGDVDARDAEDTTLEITQDPAAGTSVGLGETRVTLKVADSAGNETTCTTTVTVADTRAPTLGGLGGSWSVPGNQSGQGAALDFSEIVLDDSVDNCSGDLQFSQDPAAGTLLDIGTHDIEVSVTDAAGNTTRGVIKLSVTPPPFTTATIVHRGSEKIVAGPNVDSSVSAVTPAGYTSRGYKRTALSGNGQRVWFALFDEFPNVEGDPQTQLWSVDIDGSNPRRSLLPADLLRTSLSLETNENGSICYADNGAARRMYRVTPGDPATTAFAYFTQAGGFVFGDIRGEFKITDDASRMIYRSFVDSSIFGVDLTRTPIVPVRIRAAGSPKYLGVGINGLYTNIDLAGDGSRWITAASYSNSNWDPTVRHVVWIGEGFTAGANVTDLSLPDPASTERPLELNITDDGETIAYVDPFSLWVPTPLWIQDVGSSQRVEITDNRTPLGSLVLADNGSRFHTRTNRGHGPGSGSSFLQDVVSGRRMPAGSGYFDDAPGIDIGNVRLSDDGQTMVTGVGRGIYVLRDGVDGLINYPVINSISYRFDTDGDDCTLIVRVNASSPRSVANVFVNAYIDGQEPTDFVPGAENPLFRIRAGSRIDPVEGESDLWEIEIPLTNSEGECVKELLTEDYRLRITVLDENDSMIVFRDFAPGN